MQLNLIPAMDISSSALEAERERMRVTANNIANIHSTKDADGGVYKRRELVFSAVFKDTMNSENPVADLNGVKIEDMVSDSAPPLRMYAPYHPDADQTGMVNMPNIQPIKEMVDMITTTRAYEANLAVMKQSRDMADNTLRLGK